jgi:hypothetical protein
MGYRLLSYLDTRFDQWLIPSAAVKREFSKVQFKNFRACLV